MENKNIETKKAAIEKKFNELKSTKTRLIGQSQILSEALQLVDGEMRESQGSYKTVCELLGLDYVKEAAKVEEDWKKSQEAIAKKKEEAKK